MSANWQVHEICPPTPIKTLLRLGVWGLHHESSSLLHVILGPVAHSIAVMYVTQKIRVVLLLQTNNTFQLPCFSKIRVQTKSIENKIYPRGLDIIDRNHIWKWLFSFHWHVMLMLFFLRTIRESSTCFGKSESDSRPSPLDYE